MALHTRLPDGWMSACPSHQPYNKRMSLLVNASISAATPRQLFRKPLAQRDASLVRFGHAEVETAYSGAGWYGVMHS